MASFRRPPGFDRVRVAVEERRRSIRASSRLESLPLVTDDLHQLLKLDGVIDRVLPPTPRFLARPEVAFVRVHIHEGTVRQPPVFVGREPELEGFRDDTRGAPES